MFECFGEGKLVYDPVLKELSDLNTSVVNFILEIQEFKKGGDVSTHRLKFQAWSTGGKVIYDHCKQGTRLLVQAIPRQIRWKDKESGENRSEIIFRLKSFSIISDKKERVEEESSAE